MQHNINHFNFHSTQHLLGIFFISSLPNVDEAVTPINAEVSSPNLFSAMDEGHFRITYVGGNRVVDVPTIPGHHLLGESCIFKHRIPGECSSVVSSIQLWTPEFDTI
jgi:hypothetical protein